MKIQKLVAFGIAGVALFITGTSSAVTTSVITSLENVPSKVSTNFEFSFNVKGTGNCALKYELFDEKGNLTTSSTFEGFQYGLPTFAGGVKAKTPGTNKLVVTTIANVNVPSCVVGQKLETTITVFERPRCPAGWGQTQFNGYTGAISCVVEQPTLTCNNKAEPFTSAEWPKQCQAGCYTPVY